MTPPASRNSATSQQFVPRESSSPWVAEIGPQAHTHRRGKLQPVTAGPTNTRENQMAKGKCGNVANRNQGNMAPFEPNSPTTASPKYPNTPGKQDMDLKSQIMMLMEGIMEGFKKDIHNSLKEIQENTRKQGETLEELRENTTKQVKELNKAIQDIKKEVETIMKSETETTRDIENLGKKTGIVDLSINNRIQEIEERISDAEDTIKSIDTTVKENEKCKKFLT